MKEVSENPDKRTDAPRGTTLGGLVLRSALVTVAAALAAGALVFSLIGCISPRAYMDMCRSFGAYGIAVVYADEALDRASHDEPCDESGCDYITLASAAVEVADAAYSEKPTAAHAEYLYDFCCAYLSASCHTRHSAAMDEYYESEYAHSPELLCTVYGYDYYVFATRITAMRGMQSEPYGGGLGDGFDGCATYGDALDAYAASLLGMCDFAAPADYFYPVFGLAAYADGSDDVSALGDGTALHAFYSDLTAVAGEMESGFEKAFVQYGAYRLASALESAEGSAEFESVWTEEVASDAYAAYVTTIKQIKK